MKISRKWLKQINRNEFVVDVNNIEHEIKRLKKKWKSWKMEYFIITALSLTVCPVLLFLNLDKSLNAFAIGMIMASLIFFPSAYYTDKKILSKFLQKLENQKKSSEEQETP